MVDYNKVEAMCKWLFYRTKFFRGKNRNNFFNVSDEKIFTDGVLFCLIIN